MLTATPLTDEQMTILDTVTVQRKPTTILARAGTGKSFMLKECIRRMPDDLKILTLTFGKHDAQHLQAFVAEECAHRDVTVSTTHALALRLRGHVGRIAYNKCDHPKPVRELISLRQATLIDNWDVLIAKYDVDISRRLRDTLDAAWEKHRADKHVNFDDLIYDAPTKSKYCPTVDVVMVDEMQDWCASQIRMLDWILANNPKAQLLAVGDDRQAIYQWRGADPYAYAYFRNRAEAVLPLTVNFRCGKTIVQKAQTIVADIRPKDAAIDGEVCEGPITPQPGDFVLCRRNAPLMALTLNLLEQDIPAIMPRRNSAILDNLTALLKECKTKAQLDDWYSDKVTTPAKQDLYACAEILINRGGDPLNHLNRIFGDEDDRKPFVHLRTVHGAKGLEADNVYLLEPKLFDRTCTEEANILYVAYTRAKKRLICNGAFPT